MIPAWMRSWFGKSSPTTRARKPLRKSSSFRPAFEGLEERYTPATHPVNALTEAALTAAITAALADADASITVQFNVTGTIDVTTSNDTGPNGDSYFELTYGAAKTLAFTTPSGPITLNRVSANSFRFFEVGTGLLNLSFSGISMNNGAADNNDDGGALLFGGTGAYSITGGSFTNNSAATGNGGAIAVDGGSLSLNGVTVGTAGNGNSAENGGGIATSGTAALLFVTNASFIQSNTATGSGGGLSIAGSGTASLVNITVTGNQASSATGNGGGIDISAGTAFIEGSTIGGTGAGQPNSAAFGGGIAIRGGEVSFVNNQNIVQGNTAVQFGGGIDVSGGYTGNLTSNVSLQILDNAVTGMNSHGGGLSVRAAAAAVSFTGATISRNTANAIGSSGGGVFQNAGSLTLTNSIVGSAMNGNTAFVNGGGAEIVGGTFSLTTNSGTTSLGNNTATTGNGGGLFIGAAAGISITGTSNFPVLFNGNAATALTGGSGGAIAIDAAMANSFTIAQARFGTTTANSAVRGGAIAKFNAAGLEVQNCQFNNNFTTGLNPATDGGGGIFMNAGTVTSDPTIYDNMMSATNGGAINVMGGTLIVSAGDEFTNNTAALNGGAIHYGGGTGHTINSPVPGDFVVIANNTATSGAGGGINVDLPAANTLTINTAIVGGVPTGAGMNGQSTNAATRGNVAAGNGGAINVVNGTVSMTTVTIGGTVADPGAPATISGNRTTGGSGGGLSITAGTVTLTTSTVGSTVASATGNVANTGSGGGVDLQGGSLAIDGTTIGSTVELARGNTANVNGGGIRWLGGTLTFPGAQSTIRFNQTNIGNGGGIDITASSNLSLTNLAAISNNQAAGNGGGIAHRGDGTLTLNATVASNGATINGGGVFVSGGPGGVGTLSMTGGTIGGAAAGNTATQNGGGIHFAAGTLTVTGGSISNNTATNGSGGGINLLTANAASITNATINSNTAGGSGGGINLAATFAVTLMLDTVVIGSANEGNIAQTGNGGGINVLGGNLTLNTNTAASLTNRIEDNTATVGNGGGINIATPAGVVTITGTQATNGNTLVNSISENNAGGDGGGINLASGSLTMTGASNFPGAFPSANVVTLVQNNFATGAGGGLNQSGGSLAMTIATFAGNQANTGEGGGLNFAGGSAGTLVAPLTRVTVSGNMASGNGGGIANSGAPLFLNNFTIAGNTITGAGDGGGFANTGVLAITRIVNTTIANNTGTGAGGVRQTAGSITIGNTLVGDNAGVDIQLSAAPIEPTINLFETFAGFVPGAGDITGQTPVLAALGDYGGGTNTLALLPGSPAIDPVGGAGTGNDQRNVPIVNAIKDIGAFESRGFTLVKLAPTTIPPLFAPNDTLRTVINSQFTFAAPVPANTLRVGITANGAGEPVDGGSVTLTIGVGVNNATATVTDTANAPQPGNVFTIGANATGEVQFFAFANQFRTNANTFYTISSASRGAVNGVPAPNFNMENLGVADIAFTAQPQNTPSNQIITSAMAPGFPTVQLLDQYGNNLPLAGVNVTLDAIGGLNRFDAPTTPTVTLATDATGAAVFNNLRIIRTATYQIHAVAPQSIPAMTNAEDTSAMFNITASKLLFDAVPTPVRSGATFNVTVRATGEDNFTDPNFTGMVTLGINTFAATDPTGVTPAAVTTAVNPKAAAAGVVTFNMTSLNRGGNYTLSATSGALTPGVSNDVKVNASAIVMISASAAGSGIFNPATGGNVMPPNSVRSSNQASIVDTNKDILIVTVEGRDITGAGADIAANVTISTTSAKQFRDGMIVNIAGFTFGGNTTLFAPGRFLTYGVGAGNGNLTLDKWGDYMFKVDANDGMGFMATNNFPGIVTVIARTITVANPQILVIGPFQITTQAKDVTGDIAQNYNGPSDPTVLTIADAAGRQDPNVTGTMGTTTTQMGSSVVARNNPVRGVTVFNFNAARPVLITIGVIDQFQYFIGSEGVITLDTLATGRRRPRPLPPVINLRLRPR